MLVGCIPPTGTLVGVGLTPGGRVGVALGVTSGGRVAEGDGDCEINVSSGVGVGVSEGIVTVTVGSPCVAAQLPPPDPLIGSQPSGTWAVTVHVYELPGVPANFTKLAPRSKMGTSPLLSSTIFTL